MISQSGRRVAACGHIVESTILDFAERSLWAARVQIGRIWAPAPAGKNQLETYRDILVDVHFYFIALRNIYRFLEKAVRRPVAAGLREELESLNIKWFRDYSLGREAFEHIDQRLPGEQHEARIVEIDEGGAKRRVYYGLRMEDGIFTHSDREWNISEQRFSDIERDVRDFVDRYVRLCERTPPGPPAV